MSLSHRRTANRFSVTDYQAPFLEVDLDNLKPMRGRGIRTAFHIHSPKLAFLW